MVRRSCSILLCVQFTVATAALGAASPPPIRCRASVDCLAVAGAKCAYPVPNAEFGTCEIVERAATGSPSATVDSEFASSDSLRRVDQPQGERSAKRRQRRDRLPTLEEFRGRFEKAASLIARRTNGAFAETEMGEWESKDGTMQASLAGGLVWLSFAREEQHSRIVVHTWAASSSAGDFLKAHDNRQSD